MWIRIDTDLASHRKTLVLRTSCGLSTPEAVGHLVMLFSKLADNGSDGDISAIHHSIIEEWAGWRGEEGAFDASFRAAFVTDGMIDGWVERQGKLVARQRADRQRKRDERARRSSGNGAGVRSASAGHPQDVTRPKVRNDNGNGNRTTPTSASARDDREEPEPADESPARTPCLQDDADRVRRELPAEYHADFDALLDGVPHPASWVAEIDARLTGFHPPPIGPRIMGLAIRDFVGNGALERASLREFRRYIEDAERQLAEKATTGIVRTPRSPPQRGATIAQRAFHTTRQAIEDLP